MKYVKLATEAIFLLFVSVANPTNARLPRSSEPVTGKLMGLILDANDARVVNATVRITRPKIKREIKSGQEGEFEVEMPAGSYQITVEANGFRRFVYSPFKIKSNVSEMINIHLEVAVYTQHHP
jgi:hypothetical protein